MMLQRSAHLAWFAHRAADRGEVRYLWHELTGCMLEMSPDLQGFVDLFATPHSVGDAIRACAGTFSAEQVRQFAAVLADHGMLVPAGTSPDAELARVENGCPIKGPWIVAYRGDDGRVLAVTSRGFGPEPYAAPQVLRFDAFESALWQAIDGEASGRELALRLFGQDAGPGEHARVARTIAAWARSDRQLVRVLPAPRSRLPRLPSWAASTMPYAPVSTAASTSQAPDNVRDLTAYHEQAITDAEAQFEEAETTLSHLFSVPHPALHDRTYAQTVARVAIERGWLAPGRARVVEVGGGTGRFALGLVESLLRDHGLADLRYTIVDLSPELRRAQIARLQPYADRTDVRPGRGEALDLPDASVDLLISNEVIADFEVAFARRDDLRHGTRGADSDPAACAAFARFPFDLRDAPERVAVQTGALAFVEGIARVLEPGGAAFVTEFGALDQLPIESTHLDHAEFSVHFRPLVLAAQAAGLQAAVEPLPRLLGLRDDVTVLATTRTQFRNLRHLLRTFGADLDKRALTPGRFALACGDRLRPDRVEGLQWQPVGQRVMGLRPAEFQALVLRRPS